MTRSSIVRKFLLSTLILIAAVLVALDLALTHYVANAASDQPALERLMVRAVHLRVFEVGLFGLAAGLLIAFFYSRSRSRCLTRLASFAESVDDGRRLKLSVEEFPEDELGALAHAVAGMAERLLTGLEKAKIESARREAVLATMAEGVLAVDDKLRITYSNLAFANAVGRQHTVAEGTPLAEVVRHPALSDLLGQVLRGGEPEERRFSLVVAGEERAFEVQSAPLFSVAGRGVIAVLYDLTGLERLERVRRDFVANVSHELRTPLTAIRGYAETLLEGGLEDADNSHRFVEIIKAHSIRLGNITSDLLTLSELESGRVGTQPERISVQAAVDSSLRTVSSAARLAGVRVVRGAVEEADVQGNRTHLEQVLVNLLDNAVKFNRPDGEVRIETHRADGHVAIMVEDSGIGIPSEHLTRIFERFYRVDKARSRDAGGTGLGLSIVKHIVERMSGTVTVESNLGRGSKFIVNLPCTSKGGDE